MQTLTGTTFLAGRVFNRLYDCFEHVLAPLDPTSTDAVGLPRGAQPRDRRLLREWFDADLERAERFSRTAADLRVDLSKNLITAETMSRSSSSPARFGVEERRGRHVLRAHLNTTEDRAVLHTALRRPEGAALVLEAASMASRSTVTSTRRCSASDDFADSVALR